MANDELVNRDDDMYLIDIDIVGDPLDGAQSAVYKQAKEWTRLMTI